MAPQEYAIGIDLGTTYSCVAVWQHARAEIVANDQGNRTTPSYVAFTEAERHVGDAAVNQAMQNPTSTIFGVKRMMGRPFADAALQEDIRRWPFRVKDREGKPVVEVEYLGEARSFTPEEISAMILTSMKQTAERKLGPVSDAVITVPAYFDNAQRQATKDAGEIAGLNVLRILSEPTAAALAYGIDARKTTANTILVYDLGGGTFDVSLLRIEGSKFVVFATAGDTHLGGEDFDNILVDHLAGVFQKKHGHDITCSTKAMRRLRTNCERAKRTLSSAPQALVEMDSLYNGIDFSYSLTRAKFESLCSALFTSTIGCLEDMLKDAAIDAKDVDEVVLSGGSSRIPKVQQLLADFFGGKAINATIHFDEAVATGAAIQAAILKGTIQPEANAIALIDVTPLSLGIETEGQVMSRVVQRNTALPITKSQVYTTVHDYQNHILVQVYEGESMRSKNNLPLGDFVINDIQIAPRHVPKIEITFTIDFDGILTVTARDTVTLANNAITITGFRSRLGKDQILKMIEDAKVLDAHDERMRIQYHSLLDYATQTQPLDNAPQDPPKPPPSLFRRARGLLVGLFTWA